MKPEVLDDLNDMAEDLWEALEDGRITLAEVLQVGGDALKVLKRVKLGPNRARLLRRAARHELAAIHLRARAEKVA